MKTGYAGYMSGFPNHTVERHFIDDHTVSLRFPAKKEWKMRRARLKREQAYASRRAKGNRGQPKV